MRKTSESKASRSAWRKASRRKDPRKAMLELARHRAKRDILPINIGVEDIVIPEFCPILGIPLKVNDGLRKDNSPTLDKLIPALGYVKGNVYVISHRANRIKGDASIEELSAIVRYIKERLPE
jgi:hypothetical protein